MKILKSFGAGKVLTSVIVIFMLSWITLLSSCTATVRTPRQPRHVRSEIVIHTHVSGDHYNRDDRRNERRERRERHERHHRDRDY